VVPLRIDFLDQIFADMVCSFLPQGVCGYARNNIDRTLLDNLLMRVDSSAGFTSTFTDGFAKCDVVLTFGAGAVSFRIGFCVIPITRVVHNIFRPKDLPAISQQRRHRMKMG
jgi:hypothetical protein